MYVVSLLSQVHFSPRSISQYLTVDSPLSSPLLSFHCIGRARSASSHWCQTKLKKKNLQGVHRIFDHFKCFSGGPKMGTHALIMYYTTVVPIGCAKQWVQQNLNWSVVHSRIFFIKMGCIQ